ncbi:MAG: right-handed parallel beta-helix repeat-containing protein [Candidatus Dependentiae bacterium]
MNKKKVCLYLILSIKTLSAASPEPGTRVWNIANENLSFAEIIESQVEVITQVENDLIGTQTVVEAMLAKICSDVDALSQDIGIVDGINSLLPIFDGKVTELEKDFLQTWTILDELEETLCSDIDKALTVNSLVDTLSVVAVDFSTVFTAVNALQEKVSSINNSLETTDSLVDVIPQEIEVIQTYTALDALLELECSTLDYLLAVATSLEIITNSFGTAITAADIGTAGFTIGSSGKYILTENINFSPLSAATAITIAADDVTLDLCGNTLSQANSDTVAGVKAINMNNQENVTIKNGTISDWSAQGVDLLSSSEIILQNISINQCGRGASTQAGFNCTSCTDIYSLNVNYSQNYDEAIMIHASNDIILNDNTLYTNNESAAAAAALHIDNSEVVYIINAEIVSTTNGRAITASNSRAVTVENCKIIQNELGGVQFVDTGTSTIWYSMILSNTSDLVSTTTGIEIAGSSGLNEVVYNAISDHQSDGISVAGSAANNYIAFNNIENSGNVGISNFSSNTNSIVGNYAFKESASAYTDVVNTVTVSQTGVFPPTPPSAWQNINMNS